mmetsp:Transcript_17553/g.31675  ORF Transcript_17553/g.31675 Transcript_17553/m.31675 type:complete len:176 (-) Transcript_17553:269-796(-)|eukprot:CAMPEP_0198295468 /NCGR_PEP_ID=MMETSP1449-20131203/27764_1 /TAXON_ID=420275 /ORGANISM="Attheya septentrionalis, Strain CCMP2084" /LENGTH=175 /DNA_ID=CAMNT_0043995783 /DNA_START=182 /DNA_END=709 /DNA_ORIENTATION=-
MSSYLELFHYTTEWGLQGIKNDGCIQSSPRKNVKFGPGVYLTTTNPGQERKKTANELFGRGASNRYDEGRLDQYVRVEIKNNDTRLKKVNAKPGEFRFVSNDRILNLCEFKWDCGENETWSLGTWGSIGLLVALGGLALTYLANKDDNRSSETSEEVGSGSDNHGGTKEIDKRMK